MPADKKTFYVFLGLHSLLIGVFPFYVPVYFWQGGLDLVAISILVAITGIGFQIGLWCWDRLRQVISLNGLFTVASVLLALLLLAAVPVSNTIISAVCLALCYGVYNSFFWTTQRALFVEVMDPNRSGQAYGNFQLFVFAALQVGILAGGWLLQYKNFFWLVCFSAAIALVGAALLKRTRPAYPLAMKNTPALGWQSILRFRDVHHSRTMFLIDGCFLFLESFFWVISLFLLAHESFTRLGVIVIVLALIFGGIFFVLKNTIDRLGKRRVFFFAVALYSMSWAIRAIVSDELSLLTLFVLLVIVTFATSFFRLALNKRFYDLARESGAHRYLILKSYYSQSSLIISFVLIAWLATLVAEPAVLFAIVYTAAAVAAPLFAVYGYARFRLD